MRRFIQKSKVVLAGLVVALSFVVFAPHAASAYQDPFKFENRSKCTLKKSSFLTFPNWYKYLDGEQVKKTSGGGATDCVPHLNSPADAWLIVAAIFEFLLQLAGLSAVAFVIYGGIRYSMSRGQPSEVAAGKSIIGNAIAGLVIAVIAARAVGTVAGRFSGDTSNAFLLPEVAADAGAIGKLISLVIQIAAVVAIAFIAWGGITYSRSGGDPSSTKEAKETIIYAIVGLIIAILAQAIVSFVFKRIE